MFSLNGQLGECTQIDEGLFLSGAAALEEKALFSRHNIKRIVNLTDQTEIDDAVTTQVLRIAICDNRNVEIKNYLEDFFVFMQKAAEAKENVLIICDYGMSRSVTFMIAWLMKREHDKGESVSYVKKYNEIKEKRSMASPNHGFITQLEELEKELNSSLQLRNMI